MPNERSRIKFISNESGTRLALHQITSSDANKGIVVLAHGTFSNHRSCRGLATYLASQGFDCWLPDFQGHGDSDAAPIEPDFETFCLQDVAATLAFLHQRYPTQPINWVGHSGGGLAILMYLARNPAAAQQLSNVVLLASQATGAANSIRNNVAIRLARFITRVLGFVPAKPFSIGPQDEYANIMQQWYQWNLSGKWLGSDGADYQQRLSDNTLPILSLSASGDTFIAPPSGCLQLFNSLSGTHNQYRECGVQTGYKENYSHARLISSRNASKEIWPMVAAWLHGNHGDSATTASTIS